MCRIVIQFQVDELKHDISISLIFEGFLDVHHAPGITFFLTLAHAVVMQFVVQGLGRLWM